MIFFQWHRNPRYDRDDKAITHRINYIDITDLSAQYRYYILIWDETWDHWRTPIFREFIFSLKNAWAYYNLSQISKTFIYVANWMYRAVLKLNVLSENQKCVMHVQVRFKFDDSASKSARERLFSQITKKKLTNALICVQYLIISKMSHDIKSMILT